jgi:hypothetical protein
MNIIEITTEDGKILINIAYIVAIYSNSDGSSTIMTANDVTWHATDSVSNISRLIAYVTKGE